MIVPVQSTLDVAALTHIIDRTCPSVVLHSSDCEAKLKEACKAAKTMALFVTLPSHVGLLATYAPAEASVPPYRPSPSAASVDITQICALGARERRVRATHALACLLSHEH